MNKPRLLAMGSGLAVGYTATLVALNEAWYKEQRNAGFHFFNDNKDWLQQDKAGHFYSSFHFGRTGIEILRGAGVPEKKAVLYGGLLGIVLQAPIEFFDGFQAEYGASAGDLIANSLGAAAVISQELAWGEIRIMPKFSFNTTGYAALRPKVLGTNLPEQVLKDYNGQTYWASVNVGSFLKNASSYPKWLNVAVGYGVEEIVYNEKPLNQELGLQAYRQFYLSPDINLMHFKGKNKVINTMLYFLSIVKVPAPTLEYSNRKGFRFHSVYF
ncbi:DUF2279 domain-containing protein [Pontibacter sp. SGAir0037]|uniref:DUF2279 domain-containing protein n=1 Tax=Pontibacter sp. SGAir0037 TaxID=2571030 RepID=UPI001F0E63B3|nr:DUF2279 domain-containing protein [Pontibacter sp. SGAir0037]